MGSGRRLPLVPAHAHRPYHHPRYKHRELTVPPRRQTQTLATQVANNWYFGQLDLRIFTIALPGLLAIVDAALVDKTCSRRQDFKSLMAEPHIKDLSFLHQGGG